MTKIFITWAQYRATNFWLNTDVFRVTTDTLTTTRTRHRTQPIVYQNSACIYTKTNKYALVKNAGVQRLLITTLCIVRKIYNKPCYLPNIMNSRTFLKQKIQDREEALKFLSMLRGELKD